MEGKLIIIAGPSGVGKGTIVKKLLKYQELKLKFSVSLTTRKPRLGEINGINYYFVDKKTFLTAVKNNEMLEYAKFVGNYYGTRKSDIDKWLKDGYNVILEIEIEGTKQILKKYSKNKIISFFINSPNLKELERRIQNRLTEDKEIIKLRLEKAREEMKCLSYFDYVIVNDDCDCAIAKIVFLIKKHLLKK